MESRSLHHSYFAGTARPRLTPVTLGTRPSKNGQSRLAAWCGSAAGRTAAFHAPAASRYAGWIRVGTAGTAARASSHNLFWSRGGHHRVVAAPHARRQPWHPREYLFFGPQRVARTWRRDIIRSRPAESACVGRRRRAPSASWWRRADCCARRAGGGRRRTTRRVSRGGGGGCCRFASFFSLARCACSQRRGSRRARAFRRRKLAILLAPRARVGKVDLVGLPLPRPRRHARAAPPPACAPSRRGSHPSSARALDRASPPRRGGGLPSSRRRRVSSRRRASYSRSHDARSAASAALSRRGVASWSDASSSLRGDDGGRGRDELKTSVRRGVAAVAGLSNSMPVFIGG